MRLSVSAKMYNLEEAGFIDASGNAKTSFPRPVSNRSANRRPKCDSVAPNYGPPAKETSNSFAPQCNRAVDVLSGA